MEQTIQVLAIKKNYFFYLIRFVIKIIKISKMILVAIFIKNLKKKIYKLIIIRLIKIKIKSLQIRTFKIELLIFNLNNLIKKMMYKICK